LTGDDAVGTCFGFEVRSALPFNYLRVGEGDRLEVSAPSSAPQGRAGELVLEWTPTPALPFEGRLYRGDDDRFDLWVAQSGWFRVDPHAPSVTLPNDPNVVRREERLWSLPAILCFMARDDFSLHAAAVEVDGSALLLGAPRAFGKTTLAAAFLSAGYRLLSEDITCVRTSAGPVVIPGPAVLRVRRDIAERIEIRHAKQLGEPDDRVHFAVDPAARGDCRPVPIRAIIFLRDSDNGFRLETVAPADAVRDLWPLSFRLPTDQGRSRCFAHLAELARRTPVLNLYRPFRIEDLPATVGFIAENF
jgi:hypothetical protein